MDLLSEFLAGGGGGQQLYEKKPWSSFFSDSEVKAKFREFLQQTMTHQKVFWNEINHQAWWKSALAELHCKDLLTRSTGAAADNGRSGPFRAKSETS